jgi:hypothetical protein
LGAGHDIHCSLSGRSFVDPVTNWVLISGPELRRDLAGMIQRGRYPAEFFPEFVHELTHHDCYESGVGLALALLQLRARREALRAGADVKAAWRAAEYAIRYETAIAMLRPLAEGLALFAEFDAVPGSARVMTRIALLAGISFGQAREGETIAGLATRVIASRRFGADLVSRKANLLSQPLRSAGGGYLPGYLLVRSLLMQLPTINGNDALFDTDFFLNYVRTAFFDDPALVNLLLDPETELQPEQIGPYDPSQAIVHRFLERLRELFTLTTQQSLRLFEDVTLGGAGPFPDHPLYGPVAQRTRARTLIESAAADLRDAKANWTDDDYAIAELAEECFFRRHLMCIGTFEATVTVNKYKRVLAHDPAANPDRDPPIIAVGALDDAVAGRGPGSVEVFTSPRLRFVLTTASLGDKVVAMYSLSDAFTPQVRDSLSDMLLSHKHVEDRRAAFTDMLSRTLKADAMVAAVREHYRQQFGRAAEEAYAAAALSVVPKKAVRPLRARMADAGFYRLFDDDADLVMQFAQLSLASSIRTDKLGVAQLLEWSAERLDQLLSRLDRVEKKTRFPLVGRSDDGKSVTCFV